MGGDRIGLRQGGEAGVELLQLGAQLLQLLGDLFVIAVLRAGVGDEVVDQPVLVALASFRKRRVHDPPGVVEHGRHGGDPEVELRVFAGVGPGGAHLLFPAGEHGGDVVLFDQGLPLLAVFGQSAEVGAHLASQRGVDVDVVGAVEEAEELVVLLLRDRIVLMVVALGAAGGEAQPRGGDGVGPVDELLEAGLGAVDAGFAVDEYVAMEPGGHALLSGWVRQQVAGDLLDGEPVEGHVGVEGVDHPLAVAPGVGPGLIFLIAVRVGVAGEVEPLAGPFFAVVRGGQIAVDESLVGVRPRVGHERGDLFRGGGQAEQVELQAADELRPAGAGRGSEPLFLQAGEDVAVDGAGLALHGLEGPVGAAAALGDGLGALRPDRAGVDPGLQAADLVVAQPGAGGRHDDAGFVAHHAADQFGLGGLAGQDDRAAVAAPHRARAVVKTQAVGLYGGAVAAETGAFEDGLDVPGKVNRRLRHRPGGDA